MKSPLTPEAQRRGGEWLAAHTEQLGQLTYHEQKRAISHGLSVHAMQEAAVMNNVDN